MVFPAIIRLAAGVALSSHRTDKQANALMWGVILSAGGIGIILAFSLTAMSSRYMEWRIAIESQWRAPFKPRKSSKESAWRRIRLGHLCGVLFGILMLIVGIGELQIALS